MSEFLLQIPGFTGPGDELVLSIYSQNSSRITSVVLLHSHLSRFPISDWKKA